MNNCLNCGRIVCEAEGEGPCQTCGQEVYSKSAGQQVKQIMTKSVIDQEFPLFN